MPAFKEIFNLECEKGRLPGEGCSVELCVNLTTKALHIVATKDGGNESVEIALTNSEVHKLFEALAEFLAVSK
jgi:hypothetical protein